ncbi:MAG: glycosyltransferase [Anaerolineae bacterium]|nr:glycosyltransferase [Anaerolineae bacterium]
MKIAVVGPTYPFRGGIAHFTTLLVRHLRQRHAVSFYSYLRQYPQWLFPGNTAPDPSLYVLQEPCERTIDALSPITWWQTVQRIILDKPDILLLQWWTPFWLPLLTLLSASTRRVGIPNLFLCHQLIAHEGSVIDRLFACIVLTLGDGFIVLSEQDRKIAQRLCRNKPIRVGHHPVYNGFPCQGLTRKDARHRLGIDSDEPLLLFFGFVRRYKGLHYLLEALGRLASPPRLLIAGEFWEKEQDYRDQIERLGLMSRVIIHNRYIPNEEVETYFIAADALVLPYLEGSQSGIGMIAFHYGLPIIATSVGGFTDIIAHNQVGLIVPPRDSGALANAIERFFKDNLSDALRANMVCVRDRLSWERLVGIIEEFTWEK